ncbi:hypothetical protein ACHAXM_006654 [Skeletonema potamos]
MVAHGRQLAVHLRSCKYHGVHSGAAQYSHHLVINSLGRNNTTRHTGVHSGAAHKTLSSIMPSIYSAVFVLLPTLAASMQCPGGLKCHHGGQCAMGDKDYSLDLSSTIDPDIPFLEQFNINGEHCVHCDDGWGGIDCGRRYVQCDAGDPRAPICFNGGECFKEGINAQTGGFEYMCDCSKAGRDIGLRFAGNFCQHEEGERCDGEMFCTNGGSCLKVTDKNIEGHGMHHFECDCPPDRFGTHCEFLKNHDDEDKAECTLQCERGVCAKGFKNYDNLVGSGPFPASLAEDIISPEGEHCVCPDSYTGLTCEIAVQKCSDHRKYCYNGSTCIYDDNGDPMCDCNTAHTEIKSFAGLGCEHEGTSYCEPGLDQDQKDSFCANGGTCISDPQNRHEGCICPEGWVGDLCDIEGDVEPPCDLQCENGGSCRLGVKGYKDSYDEMNLAVYQTKHEDGEYCSCPNGYTGVRCEVDINHCHSNDGTEEHFCLNGVPCAPDEPALDGVTKEFACQCDRGTDEISQMLVGRFCEYAVTEFCTKDDHTRHSHTFCTNGGKCKHHNEHADSEHHGCCCPQGYEGDYCQFPVGTLKEGTPVTWKPMNECHEKYSSPETLPLSPADFGGLHGHIVINPAFQVSSEDEVPIDSSDSTEDGMQQSSRRNGLAGGIAVMFLAVIGLAGVFYAKRSRKKGNPQFEAEWWKGQHDSTWWKGETDHQGIDPNKNLAPISFARQWSYPADHSMSDDDGKKSWEFSNDHGDLHDVVL